MSRNDISQERVITKDGRFNYNRTFNVDTLPRINGVPQIGDMNLPDIGVHIDNSQHINGCIADIWRAYGVTL